MGNRFWQINMPKLVLCGGLILAKGTDFGCQNQPKKTNFGSKSGPGGQFGRFSAKIGPARQIIGGTDFGVTVPQKVSEENITGYRPTLSTKWINICQMAKTFIIINYCVKEHPLDSHQQYLIVCASQHFSQQNVMESLSISLSISW